MPNQPPLVNAPLWSDRGQGVEVRFVGKSSYHRGNPVSKLLPGAPDLAAFLHQIHSETVIETENHGDCGPGDGLVTSAMGLALIVVTADCVPVLLAGSERIAAVHAGWRGLVQGVIPRTLDAMVGKGPVTAWIGPCIGPCCYEVGEEVALAIASVASTKAIQRDRKPKPHIDLRLAAQTQLERSGVSQIRHLGPCTRCDNSLWSYRRDGHQAGRNHAFIWRS
ncbi:MAG: peptidoglycan editing factor PgeF [Thermoanaerobaculia bacterium]|nr:peptidoglycan editing factor PgeF [Thermoanaerobaculia bacterium]